MGPPKVSVSSNLGAFGLVLGQKLKLVAPCKRNGNVFITCILSCPPRPTTNSETKNPNFLKCAIYKFYKFTCFFLLLFLFGNNNQYNWWKNSGFVVLELVVGSGERDKLHTYISWISRSGDNLEALVLRGRSRRIGNNGK